MTIFEKLKKLQQADSQIDELEQKTANLPGLARLDALREQKAGLKNRLTEKEIAFKAAESHRKKIEGELGLISLKINAEEQKLYSGTISNPKELAGIQAEIEALRKKKDEQETNFLEHLEILENLEAEVHDLKKEEETLRQEIADTERNYAQMFAEIKEKLVVLREERSRMVPGLDESVLALYEKLRKERQGLTVVELKDGVCQGCRMELPAEEVDIMLHSEDLWQCSHCKRILVR